MQTYHDHSHNAHSPTAFDVAAIMVGDGYEIDPSKILCSHMQTICKS